jgi:hypothetical protein
MVGTALKNIGVQPLLDGVVEYLPEPTEVTNICLDTKNNEVSATPPSPGEFKRGVADDIFDRSLLTNTCEGGECALKMAGIVGAELCRPQRPLRGAGIQD